MPKINVYLPEELAAAVRDAQIPVSAICQAALENAVRDVTSARGSDTPPQPDRPEVGVFRRFTPRARQAITLANQAARDVPHGGVGTEHILLGVIDEGNNVAIRALESLDVELDDLRSELIASFGAPDDAAPEHLPFTPLAKQALECAAKEALGLGHNYIGCEHLLLGLLGTQKGVASQVMQRMGLELRTTRRAIVSVLAARWQPLGQRMRGPGPPSARLLEEILHRLEAIEQRLAS